MNAQPQPELTLTDHEETMRILREMAGDDKRVLAEAEEWGRRRQKRLPTLRRFVALLARNGIIGPETDRIDRDFVVAQCYAIATRHGLEMMGYTYLDSQSGPLASLLDIDLQAAGPEDADRERVFSDSEERAFLERVRGKGHDELGRMARDAVIPGDERLTIA